MQKVQKVSFNSEYNYHQNGPAIINSNVLTVNMIQKPNTVPLMICIPSIVPNFMTTHGGHQAQHQQPAQYGVALQSTHSTSFLLLPAREKDAYRSPFSSSSNAFSPLYNFSSVSYKTSVLLEQSKSRSK